MTSERVASDAPLNSADIDVGGTFTDAVLTLDGQRWIGKAPTTPYDLSVCFVNAIEEVALEAGQDLESLLPRLDVIRYSTTVAMNRLIERRGPRVGLITTEGHEDAILIGRGAQWTDGTRLAERRNLAQQRKPVPLIPRTMIVGVKERIDSTGRVIRPLDEDDLRRKLRVLMDRGARSIVVSLLWSFANPRHEERAKEIIREEYKEYHIGYLPVVLSHQVVAKLGEYERTMTAVLDAYLQRSMQTELSAMWDRLRTLGYQGSFLMIHNSGGSGEVFKTTASRTYNGGPVSGLMGSYHLATSLGYKNVVAGDMGGTSFDIGLVVDQSVRNYEFRPIIDRWMVGITMLQTLFDRGRRRVDRLDQPRPGRPAQRRAAQRRLDPGPACYDQGGTEPTVTDADVVLGYINPDTYYGGRMPLNRDRAERAVREKIAEPMGIGVEQAAALIRHIVDENMNSAIKREIHLRGYHPEDFALFAFGGAGPTHVSGFLGDLAGAVIFPTAPVFCALRLVDHGHRPRLRDLAPDDRDGADDPGADHRVRGVQRRRRRAGRTGQSRPGGRGPARGPGRVQPRAGHALRRAGQREAHRLPGAAPAPPRGRPGAVRRVRAGVLRGVQPAGRQQARRCLPGQLRAEGHRADRRSRPCRTSPLQPADAGAALTGKRPAWWPGQGWTETSVYDADALRPGHQIDGPVIVEAPLTTVVVPPGMRYTIDRHGLGLLKAAENGGAR